MDSDETGGETMKDRTWMVMVVVATLAIAGCGRMDVSGWTGERTSLPETASQVEAHGRAIEQNAAVIDEASEQLGDMASATGMGERAAPPLVAIKKANGDTAERARQLQNETAPEIQRQGKIAANVESALDEALTENTALKAEQAGTRNWLMTLAILGGIVVAGIGGLIAWKVDAKWGVGIGLAGLIAAGLAVVVIRYFELLALGVGIVAVLAVLALLYAVIRAIRNGTLAVEFAKAAETFKEAVPTEKRADLKAEMKGLVSGWVQDAYDKLREAGIVGKDETK